MIKRIKFVGIPVKDQDRAGVSFECDDVERTYGELVARGVEFQGPPQKQAWGIFAILKDSEGNEIVMSTGR
jgi:predicted enzyme related to lactoylglutathione lyase